MRRERMRPGRWRTREVIALGVVILVAASDHVAPADEIPLPTDGASLLWLEQRLGGAASEPLPCIEAHEEATVRDPFPVMTRFGGFDGSRVNLVAKLTDARRSEHQRAERWLADNLFAPYRNTVTSTLLTANGLDDRVRLSSGLAFSEFREEWAQPIELESSGGWVDRSGVRSEHGLATWQSFDVDLLRGDTRVSAFTRTSSIDSRFDGRDLSKRDRPFGKPGEDRLSWGGKVGWRPLDLTITSKERMRTRADSRLRQQSTEALASVSTAEVARLLVPRASRSSTVKFLPKDVWLSYEAGEVDEVADTTADAFHTLGFGLNWSRGSFYTTAGYWSSAYDQGWAPKADWRGEGIYASAGYAAPGWRGDVYAGWSSGDDQHPQTRSADSNLDGGLLFSCTPSGLPDLDFSLTSGRYATDYVAYAYEADTALFELGVELDFMKFIPALRDRSGSRLSVFYWTQTLDYRDDLSGRSADGEHLVGLRFTRPLP